MNKIDYQAKTNKELLIMVVDKVNNIDSQLIALNGTLTEHERRITFLEVGKQILNSHKEQKLLRFNNLVKIWGMIIIPILIGSGGLIWVMGSLLNWW